LRQEVHDAATLWKGRLLWKEASRDFLLAIQRVGFTLRHEEPLFRMEHRFNNTIVPCLELFLVIEGQDV